MVLQANFLELNLQQCSLKQLKMPFSETEQVISRGGNKQQTGIIIDSVTQAFYMHEERRLEDFLVHQKKSVVQADHVSFCCSVIHVIHSLL